MSLSQLPTNSHAPLTAICFLPQSAGNLTESAFFTTASIDDIDGRQPPITPDEAVTILFNRYANDIIEPLPWDTASRQVKARYFEACFQKCSKGLRQYCLEARPWAGNPQVQSRQSILPCAITPCTPALTRLNGLDLWDLPVGINGMTSSMTDEGGA